MARLFGEEVRWGHKLRITDDFSGRELVSPGVRCALLRELKRDMRCDRALAEPSDSLDADADASVGLPIPRAIDFASDTARHAMLLLDHAYFVGKLPESEEGDPPWRVLLCLRADGGERLSLLLNDAMQVAVVTLKMPRYLYTRCDSSHLGSVFEVRIVSQGYAQPHMRLVDVYRCRGVECLSLPFELRRIMLLTVSGQSSDEPGSSGSNPGPRVVPMCYDPMQCDPPDEQGLYRLVANHTPPAAGRSDAVLLYSV